MSVTDASRIPLLQVLAGKAVPYSRPGTRSAIAKVAQDGPVRVTTLGLDCDEQGDLRVHGGVDKAIHHYPFDHYADWRSEVDSAVGSDVLARPGAFGENLSTLGWTEDNVHFGDVVRAGTALLKVSQGRQPCWKLNDRFAFPRMAARVQATGRTGWYYRVLEPGEVSAGDMLERVERPFPEWPLSRLADLLFHRMLDRDLLQSAATLPLPPSWLKLIHHRLHSQQVESWGKRLDGPAVGSVDS